ncbi:hypothetical protein DFH06DRAFT_1326757 [Mycena polygramma]|nr:hypothetical protein DFH06DRAFT_1326757 [Mycena polygramma]
MTDSSRSPSESSSSTSSELDELRKHTTYLRRKLRAQQQRQEEHDTQRMQRNAVETKRCQWKAASARYYENHPEVRERKRLKMAAQRAAKKLSRRKWDPPKKAKPQVLKIQVQDGAGVAIDIGCDITPPPDKDLHAAAESLLLLQRRTAYNPFPEDLLPSDEIPTSEDDGPE